MKKYQIETVDIALFTGGVYLAGAIVNSSGILIREGSVLLGIAGILLSFLLVDLHVYHLISNRRIR